MYGNVAHEKLVNSGDWHEKLNLTDHRYMSEDIGQGLALLVSLARWAKVPAPTAEGLLTLGGIAAGQDFLKTGRTLESLQLDQLGVGALQAILRQGL
jgi:opine dehydrogenase